MGRQAALWLAGLDAHLGRTDFLRRCYRSKAIRRARTNLNQEWPRTQPRRSVAVAFALAWSLTWTVEVPSPAVLLHARTRGTPRESTRKTLDLHNRHSSAEDIRYLAQQRIAPSSIIEAQPRRWQKVEGRTS